MPYIEREDRDTLDPHVSSLAKAIAETASRHDGEAAFAGQLNYALTRLIQEIPRELKEKGIVNKELRYWMMPLMYGVLNDVALEHKRRVNVAYEAEKIVQSGDCYDAPYRTKLVPVIDMNLEIIGYQEVMLKDAGSMTPEQEDRMAIGIDGGVVKTPFQP